MITFLKYIIKNAFFLTKRLELDTKINKTTFRTVSPSEAGAGVTFKVIGTSNVSKG